MPVPGNNTDEREPLLSPNGNPPRYTEATKATTTNASESAYLRVLMVGYAIFTLSQFHANIFNTAMKQLVEGNLCRSYNDNVIDPTKDPRCKGEQTQAELSLVFSMESTFEVIPGLLLSIPYGMVADVYGRRFVAFLSILGCCFYAAAEAFVGWRSDILSPRWIWAVPITTLLGGGSGVFPVMVYTMISDVAPKSKRAGAFVIISTAPVLGLFLSGPVGFWLMRNGEWPALIFAFVAWLPTMAVIMLAPETLHLKRAAEAELSGDTAAADEAATPPVKVALPAKIRSFWTMAILSMKEMFWENPRLGLLLLSSLSIEIGKFVVVGILPQYMTKRYDLSWKEANLWLSIKSVLQMLTGLLLIPLVSQYLTKIHMPAAKKDAWIARGSLLLAAVAYTAGGLADTLPPFLVANVLSAMCIGVEPAMRSLLITTARRSGTGILFATLQVILSLGIMVSGPVIAATFRLGLHWGQAWLGLPLLLSGAIVGPTAVIMFFMNFEHSSDKATTEAEEVLVE